MKEIAKRLKDVREKIGISQVEMAQEFNYSKQIYNNLEHAKRKLQISEVILLKNRFNINPNWLISGDGNMNVVENPKIHELNNLVIDFREYGGEIDIVKKEIIRKILEKFYKKEKVFFLFKKKSHKFGNRPHFIFIKILKCSAFDGEINESKNYLRDKIESFYEKNIFLKDVKKELYSLLENIDNKDCYYLLKNPSLTVEGIKSKEKIFNFDMKIEDYLNGANTVRLID